VVSVRELTVSRPAALRLRPPPASPPPLPGDASATRDRLLFLEAEVGDASARGLLLTLAGAPTSAPALSPAPSAAAARTFFSCLPGVLPGFPGVDFAIFSAARFGALAHRKGTRAASDASTTRCFAREVRMTFLICRGYGSTCPCEGQHQIFKRFTGEAF
jgi:hypothetical protein